MWELYDDDESFQRMARGRGTHDAMFLANVLYGKQKSKKSEEQLKENLINGNKEKKSVEHV